jgi:hypothetical protein
MQRYGIHGITVTISSGDLDDLIGQNITKAVLTYKTIFADIFTEVWGKCVNVNPNVEKAFIQREANKPPQSLLPPPPSLLPPPPPPPTSFPKPRLPEQQLQIINTTNTHSTNITPVDNPIIQSKAISAKSLQNENYEPEAHKLKELTKFVNTLEDEVKKKKIIDKIKLMEESNIFPDKQIEYIKKLMKHLQLNDEYDKFENIIYMDVLNKDVVQKKQMKTKTAKYLDDAIDKAVQFPSSDTNVSVKQAKNQNTYSKMQYSKARTNRNFHNKTFSQDDSVLGGGRHTRRKSRV